jgi:hypothetical protein
MVALPSYFPWQIIWIVVFSVIYIYNWKHASWQRARNTALALLLILSAILLPLSIWGGYNLNGIENDGLFVNGFGVWKESVQLPPGTTYKSETLSNLYTIGSAYLTVTTEEEIIFYLLDENRPEFPCDEHNSSEPDYSFGFTLPYCYSEPYVIANWTMNVFNPSINTTAYVTLSIYGFEDAGAVERYSHQYIKYLEPARGMVSLWEYALIISLLAYYPYRKGASFFTGQVSR